MLLCRQRSCLRNDQGVVGSNPILPAHLQTNMAEKTKDTIIDHMFVPKHIVLSDEEAQQEVLLKYNISKKRMPSISIKDPALHSLQINAGDIIKIIRNSHVTGKATFYRVVID